MCDDAISVIFKSSIRIENQFKLPRQKSRKKRERNSKTIFLCGKKNGQHKKKSSIFKYKILNHFSLHRTLPKAEKETEKGKRKVPRSQETRGEEQKYTYTHIHTLYSILPLLSFFLSSLFLLTSFSSIHFTLFSFPSTPINSKNPNFFLKSHYFPPSLLSSPPLFSLFA